MLTNLGEGLTITIGQWHTTSDLVAEDPTFGDQVRVAQPELFINRLGDRPEPFLPVHTTITFAKRPFLEEQYGRKRHEFQDEACIMGEA